MTDLKLRFEANTYPLPESHTSVEKSPTGPIDLGRTNTPIKATAPTPKATPKAKTGGAGKKDQEANGALMTPHVKQGERLSAIEKNAALQLGRALAGKQKPVENGTEGTLLPPLDMRDRPPAITVTSPGRPPLTRRSATVPAPPLPEGLAKEESTTIETTPPSSTTGFGNGGGNGMLSPNTPISPIIVTPPHRLDGLVGTRHTLPRSSPGGRFVGSGVDDERVSFEVPNGARGRLRVSLAWFRGQGQQGQARLGSGTATPSDMPPPLPPKHEVQSPYQTQSMNRRVPISGRNNGNPNQAGRQYRPPSPHLEQYKDPHTRPVTPPSPSPAPTPVPSSPALSPTFGPLPPPGMRQQQMYPLDPYSYATLPLPTYRSQLAPQQPFQMQPRPFLYPQPQPQIAGLGPGPAWTSLPHLAHAQAQMQQQQMPRQMGSAESLDPPSGGGSPRGQYMTLPSRGGMGMGLRVGVPMGMPMGLPMRGPQNGILPYSTRSLNPNPPNQHQNHDQYYDQGHIQNQGQGPTHGQGHDQHQGLGHHDAGYGQSPYAQQGNNGRQPRWRRMLGGDFGNRNRNRNQNQNQNWQDDNQAYAHQNQDYPNLNGYGNGNGSREGKVGSWIKGITPGRAPTNLGNRFSSIWRKRARGNDMLHPGYGENEHDRDQDPFANRSNGYANTNPNPFGDSYNRPLDDRTLAPQRQREGGVMDRFFSWPRRNTARGRDRFQGYNQTSYETNGVRNEYPNERYMSNGRDQPRDRERNRQRRRDAERRNQDQRRNRQGREPNQTRQQEGRGRKLSNRRPEGGRKARKWKERVPARERREEGQMNALGLGLFRGLLN
jgi:hypothetical protein